MDENQVSVLYVVFPVIIVHESDRGGQCQERGQHGQCYQQRLPQGGLIVTEARVQGET